MHSFGDMVDLKVDVHNENVHLAAYFISRNEPHNRLFTAHGRKVEVVFEAQQQD